MPQHRAVIQLFNRTQMVPGEQAGIVQVGPANPEGIIAAEGNVDQTQVFRDAFRIEKLLVGKLIYAYSAATLLPNSSERQVSHVVVIPDKFQHTFVFVDSDIFR